MHPKSLGPFTQNEQHTMIEPNPLPFRTAARALIEVDNSILAVRYDDDAGEWFALPGGGQQPGETLSACLIRECQEELGLPIHVGNLLWVREFISPNHPDHNLPADM